MFGVVPAGSVRLMMSEIRTGLALPSAIAHSGLANGSFHIGWIGWSYSLFSKSWTFCPGDTMSLCLLRLIQYGFSVESGIVRPYKGWNRFGSIQKTGGYQYD